MFNYVLLVGIIIIALISLYSFEDYIAPPCLVCISFLLAYICACLSSSLVGWRFELDLYPVALILCGIFSFYTGGIISKCIKIKTRRHIDNLSYIIIPNTKIKIMIVVQVLLLLLYLHYYRQTITQFGGMGWIYMIRRYRYTDAYGAGLEVVIPSWVRQIIKISRANAYIALYAFAHNLSISKLIKKRMPNIIPIVLIIALYLPYNILSAARFELLVILTMGIIIWFTYYKEVGCLLGRPQKNIRKAIRKIGLIVTLAMLVFSFIAPFVGRDASEGIFKEAFSYFGRPLQAFNELILRRTVSNSKEDIETFFNIVKLFRKLGIVNESSQRFYLEFIYKNGYSLGNTYTAFRRYFADWGLVGVVLLSALGGFIITVFYRSTKRPSIGAFNYGFMIYASVSFCNVLFSYEEFFFSTVLSINYLIIFIVVFFVYKWVIGDYSIKRIRKIRMFHRGRKRV